MLGYFTVESGVVIIGDRDNLAVCNTLSDYTKSQEFACIVKCNGKAEVGGNIGIDTGKDRGIFEVFGIYTESGELVKFEVVKNSNWWTKDIDDNE